MNGLAFDEVVQDTIKWFYQQLSFHGYVGREGQGLAAPSFQVPVETMINDGRVNFITKYFKTVTTERLCFSNLLWNLN